MNVSRVLAVFGISAGLFASARAQEPPISTKGSGLMHVFAYVWYAETGNRPDPFVEKSAQEVPLLDLLVERLGAYLTEYESALSTVIADERYDQQEARRNLRRDFVSAHRRLDSEVAFLRLPDGGEWYGIRDIRKVNGKPVAGAGFTLGEVLKNPGADAAKQALAIVKASSQHNLGGARTINMPAVPLEALSARNHPRFIFKLQGTDRVAGVETRRLDFEEFGEPTLVHDVDGGNLWSRGRALVEEETGRLWRAELVVGPDPPGTFRRLQLESRVHVEFVHEPTLNMLVPKELVEDFWIARGRGSGRARYSNFRRFTTSGRIVP